MVCDVPYPMETVLDVPVTSYPSQQLLGCDALWRRTRQSVDDLRASCASLGMGLGLPSVSGDAEDLSHHGHWR